MKNFVSAKELALWVFFAPYLVIGVALTLSGCFFGSPLDKPLLVETTSVMAKRECAPGDTWEVCVDKMRKAVKP